MAINLSHGGTTIYSSATLSNQILVGTREGAVTIEGEPGSSQWRSTNRAIAGKHISALVTEPESGQTFAGAFQGGIQVTPDGGKSWQARDNGLTQNNVYSLATKRINGKVRLFAGTEPAHLFISDDLGMTWSELPKLRSVPSVPKW